MPSGQRYGMIVPAFPGISLATILPDIVTVLHELFVGSLFFYTGFHDCVTSAEEYSQWGSASTDVTKMVPDQFFVLTSRRSGV